MYERNAVKRQLQNAGAAVSKGAIAASLALSLTPALALAQTPDNDEGAAGLSATNIETAAPNASAEETPDSASQYSVSEAVDALAADDYTYGYAALTWEEYWAAEGVYHASDTSSSDVKDSHGEYDKGGYDVVTRATVNHGLHRGSYQCSAVINAKAADGTERQFEVSHWSADGKTFYTTDGTAVSWNRGKATVDGVTYTLSDYEVSGLKYVPVKVKTSDLDAFKAAYRFTANGEDLVGGYGENNLKSYDVVADVDAQTNGLKTATKASDGTFSFSKAQTGTDSGISGQALKKADVTPKLLKNAEAAGDDETSTGAYGEFMRVDLTGNYGELGAAMQAATWTYYGNDATRTKAVATFGTKFAADNWMHKSLGIQLGLTDSARCQIPSGYDGTGYWTVTVHALGFEDYSWDFQATFDNIADQSPASAEVKAQLQALIDQAKGLNQADYTEKSWANLKTELDESETLLSASTVYSSEAKGQIKHMQGAIDELVRYFSDINDGDWFQPAANFTAKKGLIGGYSGTTLFGVGDGMTRGQLATILWRYQCPDEAKAYTDEIQAATANATPMKDVDNGTFYTAAANWAYANNVISGSVNADGSTSFLPNNDLSFEQMVLIVARLADPNGFKSSDVSVLDGFTDGAQVDTWAREGMAWAINKGLVGGYTNADGTKSLRPTETVTRERGAQVLYKAFEQGILK